MKLGEKADSAVTVVLETLDCACGGVRDCLEDFQREAGEREDVAGGVVEAVERLRADADAIIPTPD